jgi:hypothetical protein
MTARHRTPVPLFADGLAAHLDVAAFLYELRWIAPAWPGRAWEEAAALERRMDLHLDALALTGRAGFELLAGGLTAEGEPGHAFVAARVALRLPAVAPKEAVADALAGPAPEQEALVDALRWEATPEADGWVAHLLDDARPRVRQASLRAATLRPSLAARVQALCADPDALVALEAQRTLALLKPGGAAPAGLERHLDAAAPGASALALELLLRAGRSAPAVAFCQKLPADAPRSLRALALDVLALAGGPSALPAIRGWMASDGALRGPGWIALGVVGDRAALAAMLERLDRPWAPEDWRELEGLFRAASLVTGNALEPAIDLDEAKPAEVAELRARAHAAWDPTLARAEERRYRRGEELGPAVLARDLAGPGHPRRDLCALELAGRFGCPVAFEPRAPYAVQAEAARAIAVWAASRP